MAELLCDSTADEAAWLAIRKNYLTASDVGAVFGLCVGKDGKAWKTRQDVVREKVYGSSFKGNRKTWFGKQEEGHLIYILSQIGVIAKLDGGLYANGGRLAYTGDAAVVSKVPSQIDLSLVSSVPDLLKQAITALQPGDLIEFKCLGYHPVKDKKPVPPPYYIAQCQAGMAVMKKPRCLLFSRVGAHDVIPHMVYADQAYQGRILLAAEQVMAEVDAERRALSDL